MIHRYLYGIRILDEDATRDVKSRKCPGILPPVVHPAMLVNMFPHGVSRFLESFRLMSVSPPVVPIRGLK